MSVAGGQVLTVEAGIDLIGDNLLIRARNTVRRVIRLNGSADGGTIHRSCPRSVEVEEMMAGVYDSSADASNRQTVFVQ